MNKIHILLVGAENWEDIYRIPETVILDRMDTMSQPPETIQDLVILDREITKKEQVILQKITRGYCLYATERVQIQDHTVTQQFFAGKMGQYLYTQDVQEFLDTEVQNYYPNPYGEKFSPTSLTVHSGFAGKISCNGNFHLRLEGNFGEEFAQIAYWKHNIPVFKDQAIDLYLEYEKTGSVEIRLKVLQFVSGSIGELQRVWEFGEEELSDVVRIDNDGEYGPVSVSILAKGEGSLTIISLHDRHSRRGHGFFLPGGQRLVSKKGEEIFEYFEKGDKKPPFAVYFSGYRTQEGFEGYYMMRSFGCPFLLLTDPRSEGGGFYVGDDDFEYRILEEIRRKTKELGFSENDVILSGASMGTYGALYYGSRLRPHALLLAKPLVNLGNVAGNERLLRAGGFPTSLDILMKNYGSLEEDAIHAFNDRLWERFDLADWTHTEFIIAYLYEDDYDPDGYQSILAHLKSKGVEVYGKGTHGRHTDNSAAVMTWFKSQYKKLLEEDFKRKENGNER